MKKILLTVLIVPFLGCAAAVTPISGVHFGFEAMPDSVGVEVDLNYMQTLCSGAKLVSWNWAENTICPQVNSPEIPRVGDDQSTPEINNVQAVRD